MKINQNCFFFLFDAFEAFCIFSNNLIFFSRTTLSILAKIELMDRPSTAYIFRTDLVNLSCTTGVALFFLVQKMLPFNCTVFEIWLFFSKIVSQNIRHTRDEWFNR